MVFAPKQHAAPGRAPAGAPAAFRKAAGAPAQAASPGVYVPRKVGTPPPNYVSMKVADQTTGGLLDDKDVIITLAEATTWDYNGQQEPTLALHLHLVADDGEEADQYYSAGSLERMQPSDDAQWFVPITGSGGINNNTNAGAFMASLEEQGFPAERWQHFNGSLVAIEGVYCHVNRVPQKKRNNLPNQREGGREATVLLCTKLIALPEEKRSVGKAPATAAIPPKARAAAQAHTASPAPAPANGNADVNDEAMSAVVEVLAKEGTVAKKQLGMKVFRQLGQSVNRSKILNLVTTDDFLAQDGAPWVFDGDSVSAPAE